MRASRSNDPSLWCGMAGVNGWSETPLAELEARAADLREQAARDPQHPSAELKDVEWEMEKRNWRNQP